MLTDNRFVAQSFEKNFKGLRNKRIILYGKGPYTKLILDLFSEYHIIGIMDRDLESGMVYGKPILSYEKAVDQKADMIIVISRPESIKEVYKRISGFCSINHISLYGINGENLYEKFSGAEQEVEDLLVRFEKSFASCKNKNIVLYGKGYRTKLILDAFPDYHIIGIMDRTEKEGEIFNKKILSFEEAVSLKADMIIVVGKPDSIIHVYKRIHEFCSYHHILLYDMNGENLFNTITDKQEEIEYNPYFDICEDDLKEEIMKHDIISFDIFDTLVMRRTLLPTDVFEIVEDRARRCGISIPKFKELRMKAEHDILHTNPNIYDIYDRLRSLAGITEREKKRLLELEIEVEKEVLIRRERIVEVLKFALSHDKTVCLTSDMYLPVGILTELLGGLGITGYRKIFVSCDYCASKCSGLFEIVKKQIIGKSYLHIGDNKDADGTCARKAGMDVFLIKKALDMLDMSSYSKIRSCLRTVNERSMAGFLIARAFNNPFSLYSSEGKLPVDQAYDLGYLFVAPLITTFIFWFVKRIRRTDYAKILFSARDGFIIQKLYHYFVDKQCIRDVPDDVYFQISRWVCTNASMQSEEDIKWLFSQPYAYSPEKMLCQKFDLQEEEVLAYDRQLYDDVPAYALAHKDKIYDKSSIFRNRYMKYMESIGIQPGDSYAFFDFVASGTCQLYLSKVMPLHLDGYYLCFFDVEDEKKRRLPTHAMITEYTAVKDNSYASYGRESFIHRNYFLLETVITSLNPTLKGFSEEGEPMFDEEQRGDTELQFVKEVQAAIEDYFHEYVDSVYVEDANIETIVPDKIYSFKDLQYTDEHCSVLDEYYLFEDLGRGKIPLPRN